MYLGNNYRLERKIGNTFSVYELQDNAYVHICIMKINQKITHNIKADELDRIVKYFLNQRELLKMQEAV